MKSPEIIQMPGSSRGGGTGRTNLHLAYCKTNAPAAAFIICYLDTDVTGTEITVNCGIAGGGNLNEALPRLTDGLWITVWGGRTFFSTISTISRSGNVVTATLASVTGFNIGDRVVITGVADGGFNGTFTITGVGANTITYAQTGDNATSTGGMATVNNGWFCATTFQRTEDCTCTSP